MNEPILTPDPTIVSTHPAKEMGSKHWWIGSMRERGVLQTRPRGFPSGVSNIHA